MAVLVTSNFDDDSIKNELASMDTPFSHYKYMGKFLDANYKSMGAFCCHGGLIQSAPKSYAAFTPPQ